MTIDTATRGWHSLGLYAAPGEKISVIVHETAIPLKLFVQIGSHTDSLWHLEAWTRAPEVVQRFSIKEVRTIAASVFGGLVYIDVPVGTVPQKIEITITGAVEAPFYQLGVTTRDDWRSRNRRRPGPWAELAGQNAIFTVPSGVIRGLDDPKPVVALWDQIIAAQDALVSRAPRQARAVRRRQTDLDDTHARRLSGGDSGQ